MVVACAREEEKERNRTERAMMMTRFILTGGVVVLWERIGSWLLRWSDELMKWRGCWQVYVGFYSGFWGRGRGGAGELVACVCGKWTAFNLFSMGR